MAATTRRLAYAFGVASTVLWAGAFWEDVPAERWTSDQVEKLLIDSPWARPARVDFVGSRSMPRISFPDGRDRGGRFPTRFPRFPAGDGGWKPTSLAAAASPDAEIIVRWESAKPVRLALAAASGSAPVQSPSYRILLVSSLPLGAAHAAEKPNRLLSKAALLLKDRPQVAADRIEVVPQPGAPGVRLFFPLDVDVSLADKSFQFLMQPGDYQILTKFKPQEMVFRGRLEM